MQIDKIYINTHRYDLKFTRICIASIRYWYPEIAINLIIDYSNGATDTKKMQRNWNIGILETGKQRYGWGFGKFEPLFLNKKETFLVLDSDTVLAGPVLDKLSGIEADFVVDKEVQPAEKLKHLYYDPEEIIKLYPNFRYPGYSFNSGQWVGNSKVLSKNDFDNLITWKPSPKLSYPQFFKQADQGLFNLIIHLKEQEKKVSVARIPLMIWPDGGAADFIDLDAIKNKERKFPYVIHWAGMKFKSISEYPRMDILSFYEEYFYHKYSALEKYLDKAQDKYLEKEKKFLFTFKKLQKHF
ncbi:hypothetical protein [Longitalea arenae]|uniref:hypothetical protein n=1 Tax=Longitalea arenae TaxID=2812558 RepID=UPI0019679C9A|nr:hypothetical protein [Longitalea arenae]